MTATQLCFMFGYEERYDKLVRAIRWNRMQVLNAIEENNKRYERLRTGKTQREKRRAYRKAIGAARRKLWKQYLDVCADQILIDLQSYLFNMKTCFRASLPVERFEALAAGVILWTELEIRRRGQPSEMGRLAMSMITDPEWLTEIYRETQLCQVNTATRGMITLAKAIAHADDLRKTFPHWQMIWQREDNDDA